MGVALTCADSVWLAEDEAAVELLPDALDAGAAGLLLTADAELVLEPVGLGLVLALVEVLALADGLDVGVVLALGLLLSLAPDDLTVSVPVTVVVPESPVHVAVTE